MVAQDHRAVVVADDDPALRLLCRINLELEGYRVVEADSGEELERVLATDDVSVILLDIQLGSDDGVSIARALRESHPNVGVAFFSGSVPNLDGDARELVTRVLPKPFSLEELSRTVQELARRSSPV
jgi:DNA-binding response OmpR family regulator